MSQPNSDEAIQTSPGKIKGGNCIASDAPSHSGYPQLESVLLIDFNFGDTLRALVSRFRMKHCQKSWRAKCTDTSSGGWPRPIPRQSVPNVDLAVDNPRGQCQRERQNSFTLALGSCVQPLGLGLEQAAWMIQWLEIKGERCVRC